MAASQMPQLAAEQGHTVGTEGPGSRFTLAGLSGWFSDLLYFPTLNMGDRIQNVDLKAARTVGRLVSPFWN